MMGRMNMGKQIATAPASRMACGGPAKKMNCGGTVKKMAKGGKMDGCCMKGHTKGMMK